MPLRRPCVSILEFLATEHRLPPEALGRPLVPTAIPDVQPGQLWMIELSPEGASCPELRRVIDRANAVIYDRAVAGIVAESLRLGLYAEAAADGDEADDNPTRRAGGLARDGWAVVRLVSARPTQRERIVRVRRLIDELAAAKAASEVAVTVLAELGDGVCEPTESRLARLDQIVVTYPRDARLTIVVDGINRHAAARGRA